jgi:hypothetical protein
MSTINLKNTEVSIAVAARRTKLLLAKNKPVMLWGKPGIGKSDLVRQIASELGVKVIEFRTNIREPVDVRGIPVPCELTGTTRWFVPDELPQVERDGECGILFIDEINTGTLQMMAVMFGLVLDRRVGEYVLPKGWMIVAAGNMVADKAAAQRMPTALRNRFAHIYAKADLPAWASWANANGIAPELVAYLRLMQGENSGSGILHIMPVGDENAFPTPRSWAQCSDFVDAPKEDRMAMFASFVGDAYATGFDAFIDLYHSIGSLDAIVKDPKGANVPTDPSLRYAVCTGLARMATKKTFPNIITFAKRLNRESQILLVSDATQRDEDLKNTAVYGEWAVANQDITLQ